MWGGEGKAEKAGPAIVQMQAEERDVTKTEREDGAGRSLASGVLAGEALRGPSLGRARGGGAAWGCSAAGGVSRLSLALPR